MPDAQPVEALPERIRAVRRVEEPRGEGLALQVGALFCRAGGKEAVRRSRTGG